MRAVRSTSSRADLEDVLRSAHVLFVCLPLTAETAGLVGERELSLLPPDALVAQRGALAEVLLRSRSASVQRAAAAMLAGVDVDLMCGRHCPRLPPAEAPRCLRRSYPQLWSREYTVTGSLPARWGKHVQRALTATILPLPRAHQARPPRPEGRCARRVCVRARWVVAIS